MSKRTNKLLVAVLCAGLLVPALTTYTSAAYAADKDPVAERHKDRKTYIVSQSVGKHAQKAYELYSKDDIQGAIAELKDASPGKDFDKAYINRFLGNLYAALEGQTATAIKYLEAAVKPDLLNAKEQADTMRLLADLNLSEEHFTKALTGYRQWEAFTGEQDPKVKVRMAQANYELKHYAAMIPLVNDAIKLSDKPNKNAYILKLSSYYERKDYKNSVKVLEQLVQYFPNEERWWTQLGMFYMMTEDYNQALATLDTAYRNHMLKKPQEILALVQLYSNNGIPWKAAQLLEKYIKDGTIKRESRMVKMLANSFLAAKELPEAAKYFAQAADMDGDAELYRKQGSILVQMQNYKGAISALQKALDHDIKRKGSVHMMMAEAYLNQNNLRAAYNHVLAAAKYPRSKKEATSWAAYLKDKAERQGVNI